MHWCLCVQERICQATTFRLGQCTGKQSMLGAHLWPVRILDGTGQLRAADIDGLQRWTLVRAARLTRALGKLRVCLRTTR